jgi:hypothetical protein
MKMISVIAACLALSGALAACSHGSESISIAHGAVHVHPHDQAVTIAPRGQPDARMTADGALRIGTDEVTLSAEQRAEVTRYVAAAMAIPEHAIATGKAGAATGVAAVTEVVHGLANGDTSQIGAKVEAKADEVRREARNLCEDIAGMRGAQDALATSLEAFRPYAVIAANDDSDCRKETTTKQGP